MTEPRLTRSHYRLNPAIDFKFAKNGRYLVANRFLTDSEAFSYCIVVEPLRDNFEDFPLAGGQLVKSQFGGTAVSSRRAAKEAVQFFDQLLPSRFCRQHQVVTTVQRDKMSLLDQGCDVAPFIKWNDGVVPTVEPEESDTGSVGLFPSNLC